MRRTFEQPVRRRVAKPPVRSVPSRTTGVTERVLALQRTAGNRAVARLLRSPVDAPLESRPLPLDDKSSTTLKLEGIGSFAIESLTSEVRRQVPKDREEKDAKTITAWHVTKRLDAHSQALFKASLAGTNIPVAEVTFKTASGQFVLRLRNAMITNFSASSASGEAYESFTLEGELEPIGR